MKARVAVAVLFFAVTTAVALALPALRPPAGPVTEAQAGAASASYEIEVFPGVGATGTPTNLGLTSGWHDETIDPTFGGIDIGAGRGTAVHAVFRVLKTPSARAYYGRVSKVVGSGDGCRMVEVEVWEATLSPDGLPVSEKELGRVRYVHVVPKSGLSTRDVIALASGADAEPLGEVVAFTKDGASCPTDGDHLHQSANVNSATTSMWRNFDRAGDADDDANDDGYGFDPPEWGYAVDHHRAPQFCSDTWVFKVYPPRPSNKTAAEWDPLAGPVERCAAPDNAPTGLSVTRGDGTLTLAWTALVASAKEKISYQVRWRLTASASGGWSEWEPTAASRRS